ncbi:MAG: hypothetical protein PVJ38_02290 [Candidatus Bathyarchaeota archaeon]|jgi:hypothetical protein
MSENKNKVDIEKMIRQVKERAKKDIDLEIKEDEEDERVQQTLKKIDRLRKRVE